jgi:hypothetical protein
MIDITINAETAEFAEQPRLCVLSEFCVACRVLVAFVSSWF